MNTLMHWCLEHLVWPLTHDRWLSPRVAICLLGRVPSTGEVFAMDGYLWRVSWVEDGWGWLHRIA